MNQGSFSGKSPPSLGIMLMVTASALIAATSLIAKVLGVGSLSVSAISPLQVSAGRFLFAFVTLLLVLAMLPPVRPRLSGAQWHWHALRSFCGWLGVTSMFAAVAKMPVAEATAISFLSPLVTMAIAILCLGESLNGRKIAATGLAVSGALLILKPGSAAFQFAGLFALAAAVLMGLEMIIIKRLSDTEPAMRVLLINNAIGAVISLVAASAVWIRPTMSQWSLMLALGVIMVSGQAIFIQAMKRAEASVVAPAFYSVLVFAACYDFAFFGVRPSLIAAIGSAFVVWSALLLAKRGKVQ